jgi:hypothetical protein
MKSRNLDSGLSISQVKCLSSFFLAVAVRDAEDSWYVVRSQGKEVEKVLSCLRLAYSVFI